jgi:UDP-galactose transporter B1
MARSKPTPIRRETSSEYISKYDRIPRNREVAETATNGETNAAPVAAKQDPGDKKEAGVVQLVIAVAGIYASLYVFLGSHSPSSNAAHMSKNDKEASEH